MKFYTVYKITNTINNKSYIGAHETFDVSDGYMGSGIAIASAIKKYGIDSFTKEILHIFDNEKDMYLCEAFLVEIGNHTYNLIEGGNQRIAQSRTLLGKKQNFIKI